MKTPFSEIILGSAQLGIPYGIGKWMDDLMPKREAFALLDTAWEQGITTIDTSPEYGIAEERISEYLRENPNKNFHIISKIKTLPNENKDISLALENWLKACPFTRNANCASLSILLHKEADIYREPVVETLNELVVRNKIFCWGVSVYEEKTARYAATTEDCLLVQIPFNILDQSFGSSGIIELMSVLNKVVMARSVFSKGVLLKTKKTPVQLEEKTLYLLDKLNCLLTRNNILINDFALATAKLEKGIDHLVLGADCSEQVKSWKIDKETYEKLEGLSDFLNQLRSHSSERLKPQNWKMNVS